MAGHSVDSACRHEDNNQKASKIVALVDNVDIACREHVLHLCVYIHPHHTSIYIMERK